MSGKCAIWMSLRLTLAVLIGLGTAALLGRILPLFLYACILSAAAGGLAAFLLLGRRFLTSVGIDGAGSSLSRILGSLLIVAVVFSLLTFGPLNIDRSFSVWMLRRVSLSEQPLTIAQTQKMAADFFGQGSDEIQRRILEQERLGNLRVDNGAITLTAGGQRVVMANEWLSIIFGLNPKYARAESVSPTGG